MNSAHPESVYIFSYGSNMLYGRIRQRIASVEVVCCHELRNYRLIFNKRSKDLSSKANLIFSRGESVHGVIHRIALNDKYELDKYEGLGKGYEMEYFETMLDGRIVQVGFYMVKDQSHMCDDDPYHWYHECVLYGAMENGLDYRHVEMIRNIPSKRDTHGKRNAEYDILLRQYRQRFNGSH